MPQLPTVLALLAAHTLLGRSSALTTGLSAGARLSGGRAADSSKAHVIELESEAAQQVLHIHLGSARSHLKDVVLRIEDYTNSIEMGVRRDVDWTAADADDLTQRLARPTKKALSALQAAREDLHDNSAILNAKGQGRLDLVEHAIGVAEGACRTTTSIVNSVKTKSPTQAIKDLNTIRSAVDTLDALNQALSRTPLLT